MGIFFVSRVKKITYLELLKVHQTAPTAHVRKDSLQENHEVGPARSIEVPLVESITHSGLNLSELNNVHCYLEFVVNGNVGGGEVVWYIAKQVTQPILENVSDTVSDMVLVQKVVVGFTKR